MQHMTRLSYCTDDEILRLLEDLGGDLALEAHNRIEKLRDEERISDSALEDAYEEGEEAGRQEGASDKEADMEGSFNEFKGDMEYLISPLNGSYKSLILNRLNNFGDSIYGTIYKQVKSTIFRVSLAKCYQATGGAWPLCGTGRRVGKRQFLHGGQTRDALAPKKTRQDKTCARQQRRCAWLKNRKR